MAVPDVQANSFGWNMDLRMIDQLSSPVNISTATTCDYVAKKPSGSKITVAATFITDGSDGRLRREIAQGDIDEAGTWRVQAHVITPTQDLWSSVLIFEVKGNL